MDFSTVKGISIPQGDVRIINDSNSNCLWTNLKFNQLMQNGNFADGTNHWAAFSGTASASSNIMTYTVNSVPSNFYACRIMQSNPYLYFTAGHYYYVRLKVKSSRAGAIVAATATATQTATYGAVITCTNANEWYEGKSIFYSASSDFMLWIKLIDYTNVSIGDTIMFQDIMFIDLTKMYGENLHPSTATIAERDCANIGHPLTQYQPYTPIW